MSADIGRQPSQQVFAGLGQLADIDPVAGRLRVEIIQHLREALRVIAHIVNQAEDALHQLRNHGDQNQRQHQQHDKNRDHVRDDPLLPLLLHSPQRPPLQKDRHRVHDVGEGDPRQHRGNESEESRDAAEDRAQPREDEIKQNRGAERDRIIHPLLVLVFFVQLHPASSSVSPLRLGNGSYPCGAAPTRPASDPRSSPPRRTAHTPSARARSGRP